MTSFLVLMMSIASRSRNSCCTHYHGLTYQDLAFISRSVTSTGTTSSSCNRHDDTIGFSTISNKKHSRLFASVTGTIYDNNNDNDNGKNGIMNDIEVTLFTKEGCTLCDKVKDVLSEIRDVVPHSLRAVDITDDEHCDWYDKYKWDIPVLHVNGKYWVKHRLTSEEAEEGLKSVLDGSFISPRGEPDAAEMERRQAQRNSDLSKGID